MSFLAPSHPSLTHLRTFTQTARTLAKSTAKRLAFEHSAVPIYPYGASMIYKQSNFGLYGKQKIRYGNMVSEKNEIKTRRYWRPNVKSKRLWSEALGKFVRTRITTRVLRTVDKAGGLDEYLLGEKSGRIKELGMGGWKLRWRIMQTDAVKQRFAMQRKEMGLPPKIELDEGKGENSQGQLVSQEVIQQEMKEIDQELLEGTEVGLGEDSDILGTEVEPEFMHEEPLNRDNKVVI